MEDYAVSKDERTTIGFWVYLMTDCLLFATLFATYVVLRPAIADGPASRDIFDLPTALIETLVLLSSSLAVGFALMSLRMGNKKRATKLLALTGILGFIFLGIEIHELTTLAVTGASWKVSGFLSGFFALVGTHGLHVFFGLIWLAVLMGLLTDKKKPTKQDDKSLLRKLGMFALYWHFLDLVWIFVFTIVYLMGVSL